MKFSEFIGNTHIRDTLISAIRGERISNAYLFAGPRNLGKRTLALLCAQAILCMDLDSEPCGQCNSCRHFELIWQGEGIHPDLNIIEPQGKFIRVEQIRRDLIALTQMRPAEGKHQVFIIDQAETMHLSAANAFLKTLEEAPGCAVFFLISANPGALLQTVLSRCQRFSFQHLELDELADELERRKLWEREQALAVASLSRGAIGRALSFNLERHREEREISLKMLKLALGEGRIEEIFALAARLHKENELFEERMATATILLRDLMLLASAGSGVRVVNEDIKQELLDLARGRSPRRMAQLLSLIAEMSEALIRNVRIDTVSENVMLAGRDKFSSSR